MPELLQDALCDVPMSPSAGMIVDSLERVQHNEIIRVLRAQPQVADVGIPAAMCLAGLLDHGVDIGIRPPGARARETMRARDGRQESRWVDGMSGDIA